MSQNILNVLYNTGNLSDASSSVNSFSRMFFDIKEGEKIFIWASLYTFTGNYSILDYFNVSFILEFNSEFRDFKLWDQKLQFKGFIF